MTLSNTRFVCDSCYGNFSKSPRIQCAVCEDVYLCIECLASQTPISKRQHSIDHPYRIVTWNFISIDSEKWSVSDDLLLLESVETFGLGNWEDVSSYIGKSPKDCQERMNNIFYKTELPHSSDLCTTSFSGYQSLPACHEISGYMPFRDEFEVYYENDAEAIIKDLAFMLNDNHFDIYLKHTLLHIYSGTLYKRKLRHKLAYTLGIFSKFKELLFDEKSRDKSERDLFNRFRSFLRFCDLDEYAKFIEGLIFELKLRKRINILQECRKSGIRNIAEVERFCAEKGLLENYLKNGGNAIINRNDKSLVRLPNISSFDLQANNCFTDLPINGKKTFNPLFIEDTDGYEILSEREREICSLLRLYPRIYLQIKETLIKESMRHGGLKRAQARTAVKIDVNKTSRLYDFFVEAGWIKTQS